MCNYYSKIQKPNSCSSCLFGTDCSPYCVLDIIYGPPGRILQTYIGPITNINKWISGQDNRNCEHLDLVQNNSDIVNILLMSDKGHFHVSDYVNKQNCHCWAPNNPNELHWHPLHSAKVIVCCAVSSHGIILGECGQEYSNCECSGFGGLGVACWPLVPKFAGSNPAEAVGFLEAEKSSARLPSEGK